MRDEQQVEAKIFQEALDVERRLLWLCGLKPLKLLLLLYDVEKLIDRGDTLDLGPRQNLLVLLAQQDLLTDQVLVLGVISQKPMLEEALDVRTHDCDIEVHWLLLQLLEGKATSCQEPSHELDLSRQLIHPFALLLDGGLPRQLLRVLMQIKLNRLQVLQDVCLLPLILAVVLEYPLLQVIWDLVTRFKRVTLRDKVLP